MRALLGALSIAVAAGCAARPIQATAFQPHPRQEQATLEEPNASRTLYIFTNFKSWRRDTRVRNSAQFVAVTRDLVRFHVGVAGSTDDYTVWLEDESGRVYKPEREVAMLQRHTLPWWRSSRRLSMGSIDVSYGVADYVFRGLELMGPQRRSLTLHVAHRDQRELRYTWTFGEGVDVRHGFFKSSDPEFGFISIPGPGSMVRSSRYEDGTH
jgi:hypothetical protein